MVDPWDNPYWAAVNVLGGSVADDDIRGQGYVAAIDDALAAIEKLPSPDDLLEALKAADEAVAAEGSDPSLAIRGQEKLAPSEPNSSSPQPPVKLDLSEIERLYQEQQSAHRAFATSPRFSAKLLRAANYTLAAFQVAVIEAAPALLASARREEGMREALEKARPAVERVHAMTPGGQKKSDLLMLLHRMDAALNQDPSK